jgi:hypothetical protein
MLQNNAPILPHSDKIWPVYLARSDKTPYLTNVIKPGSNPTTSIYNASVVKIYNAANSLACF